MEAHSRLYQSRWRHTPDYTSLDGGTLRTIPVSMEARSGLYQSRWRRAPGYVSTYSAGDLGSRRASQPAGAPNKPSVRRPRKHSPARRTAYSGPEGAEYSASVRRGAAEHRASYYRRVALTDQTDSAVSTSLIIINHFAIHHVSSVFHLNMTDWSSHTARNV